MNVNIRVLSLITFCIGLSLSFEAVANGQVNDSYSFVRTDWHLAGLSESRSDWPSAIQYYQRVIDESEVLPLDIREWYRGTAYYGISRCESRLQHSAAARASLVSAFERHFWNFDLTLSDSIMTAVCGRTWVDSLCRYWNNVLADERPMWGAQPVIMYYPTGYDSTSRWPLVIAMHGGNGSYESFAHTWRNMADAIKAVIAVPAGVERESQITNSWGADFGPIEKAIVGLAEKLSAQHRVNRSQIYLTGFSQGAQASLELALRRPDLFRGAIPMSGFLSQPLPDSVLLEAARRQVRIYAITGQLEDPEFARQIKVIHERCTQEGIPFTLDILPGMIHEVPLDLHDQFLRAWNWVRSDSEAAHQATGH